MSISRTPCGPCTGGRFDWESNWRFWNWETGDPLGGALLTAWFDGLYFGYEALLIQLPGPNGVIVVRLPGTEEWGFFGYVFPTPTHPHFPYGMSVLPDH